MSDTNKLFYLDREGLKKYDELIKEYINGRDSVIKGALVEGDYQSIKELSDALNGLNSEIDNIDDIPDRDIYALFDMGDGYILTTLKKVDISGISYEEVDLGLTSGLKWANKNVGAQTEEDYGTYFSWGNTDGYTVSGTKFLTVEEACQFINDRYGFDVTTKEELENALKYDIYNAQSYTMDNFGIIDGYSFDENTYNTTSGASFDKTVLDSDHDAATVNMKNGWRMPTNEEYFELLNAVKSYEGDEDPLTCTFIYLDKEGNRAEKVFYNNSNFYLPGFSWVLGVKFTNTSTGAYVYFPTGGDCSGSMLGSRGLYSSCWSSSIYNNFPGNHSTAFTFGSESITYQQTVNWIGHNIRAVKQ